MSSATQLQLGVVFARDYRVVGQIAQGGMGAVYVAEQLSTGKRRALKLMLPRLVSDPRSRERFALEARAASRVASDHVVDVVGAGVDDATGVPWIAMELLEGAMVADVVERRGALPLAEVGLVVEQLGHALAAAHRAGIVHRDLKPENVFLAAPRRPGVPFTVKVLDFGIAKLVNETMPGAHTTGALGSPAWMSPEQANAGAIGPAADVWALGLMVFYMLTGRYYWRAANEQGGGGGLQRLLMEMLVDPMEPASQRAARLGVAGAIPPGFDAWFAGCVARDPAGRYPEAGAAVAAFAGVVAGAGVGHAFASAPGFVPMGGGAVISTTPPFGPATPQPWSAQWTPGGVSMGATPASIAPGAAHAQPSPAAPTRSSRTTWIAAAVLGGVALLATGTLVGLRMSDGDEGPRTASASAPATTASASAPNTGASQPPAVPSAPPVAATTPVAVADDPKPPRAEPASVPSPTNVASASAPAPVSNLPVPSSAPRAGPAPRAASPVASASSAARSAEPPTAPPPQPLRGASPPGGHEGFVGATNAPRAPERPVPARVVQPASPVDTASVQRVLAQYTERCWSEAQRRIPGHPTERIVVEAHLTALGRAYPVTVQGATDQRLVWCIAAAMQTHRFAPPEQPFLFRARMTLTPD